MEKKRAGKKLKLLSLFSGIGAVEEALKILEVDTDLVGFSEIDKYAIKSYCAVHEVSEDKNLGDITKIDIEKLPIDIDLISHGSPCQDFSIAGLQKSGDKGSETRSSLMWNVVDIIKHCKPKYVIWENVKNLISKKHRHNFDAYLKIMENIGYKNYFKVLNAKNFNIPQNRERVFTISIRDDINKEFIFPKEIPLKLRLKDILEKEVEEKYYMDKPFHLVERKNVAAELEIKALRCVKEVQSIEGICPTLTTMQGGNTQPKVLIKKSTITAREYKDSNKVMVDDYKVRKLTPLECWRLMGFNDESFYKASDICSNTQLYKQAGNSIVVNVLIEIFKNLLF